MFYPLSCLLSRPETSTQSTTGLHTKLSADTGRHVEHKLLKVYELVVCCYGQRSGLQSSEDLQTNWSVVTAREVEHNLLKIYRLCGLLAHLLKWNYWRYIDDVVLLSRLEKSTQKSTQSSEDLHIV